MTMIPTSRCEGCGTTLLLAGEKRCPTCLDLQNRAEVMAKGIADPKLMSDLFTHASASAKIKRLADFLLECYLEEIGQDDPVTVAIRLLKRMLAGQIREAREVVGVRVFDENTAHVGPWTTVHACVDCGTLVAGGVTRCRYCSDQDSMEKLAPLMALFDSVAAVQAKAGPMTDPALAKQG